MMNSLTKAQAHFRRQQFQNSSSSMGLTKINRANLSHSIVLHHNKLNSLLSTVGRYNDIIGR